MFLGHFGIGFGAKKYAPALSLGLLFIAAQFLDLLWPTLLLLDLEHVSIEPGNTKVTPLNFTDYPYSHSLAFVLLWSVLLGLLVYGIKKQSKYAWVVAICVASHWFLDLLVHRPDLPLLPGNPTKLGLGGWNYPVITILLEALFFFGGLYLYTKTTVAKNKTGKYGLIGLVAFFLLIEIANMAGPPPPSVTSIAWAGQLQWLFVVIAFFVDKHRTASNQ
jgi:hypothetical protein